jgi:uncharacterized protein with FMN-binding domain
VKLFNCPSVIALSIAAFANLASPSIAGTTRIFPSPPNDIATVIPASSIAPQVQMAAAAGRYRNGSFVGPVYDAYYGLVQVRANIQAGRLVSVDVLQFPNHQRTSRAINSQAIPMLETQVIKAQNTRVNLVSGATLTSKAYLRSLNGALGNAGA